MRKLREETKDFSTRVAFCPYLIKYGMCLPETQQKIILEYMLLADDIVQILKSKDVNSKLKLWRHTLESKDLRFSDSKTEYSIAILPRSKRKMFWW